MPWFPDSVYGLAYLAALIIFGAITWFGPNREARKILLILTIHWLTTRTIDWYDFTNFYLWIAQDIAVFLALLIYCKGMAGRAIAALFFIVLAFDNYSIVTGGTFEAAAAVAETVGYLAMLIMAGAAHVGRGKLAKYYGTGTAAIRNVADTTLVWLQIKRPS